MNCTKRIFRWGWVAFICSLMCLDSDSQTLKRARSESGTPRLMQGPMVGYITENEITIWARANGEFPIQVEYDRDADFTSPNKSEAITASKAEDYTVRLGLKDLQPGTKYYYRVLVDGRPDANVIQDPPLQCKTAPAGPAEFSVAFGSCARVQRNREQPIWNVVQRLQPDLFLWLGDNIYGDSRDPDILAEEYRRQREVAALQPVNRSASHLAIWDDHDYALNNHDKENPVKDLALKVFQHYWANPSYGLPDAPGVFFRYSYGGVDFFFLDVRYHRDGDEDPDSENKTMLGKTQLEWLMNGLKESQAAFKVLASGSAWSMAQGKTGDSWAAYMYERNRLFSFIRDRNIGGVVLLSGDTHVGELNAIPWSNRGGYDFYELVSSPLAQATGNGWMTQRPELRIRRVFDNDSNVGFIEFNTTQKPATMRFRLFDTYGNSVWQALELNTDELKNGVESWPDKMDAVSKARYESQQSGKGYYEP